MNKLAFFQELFTALEEQQPAVAATVVRVEGEAPGINPGEHFLWRPGIPEGVPVAITPEGYPGAPALAASGGEPVQDVRGGRGYETGKLAGERSEPGLEGLAGAMAEVAPAVLAERRPQLTTLEIGDGRVTLFLEPVSPEPEVLILGGGHVGQQVAALAGLAGYRVTVVDDRPDFANEQLFPAAARVICAPFTAALQELKINPSTFIVIVTRGHRYDYECLRAVIQAPAAYIGMIGSRRRIQGVRERLLAEGINQEALARVHAPIGLDIGAETPAEIAISILAEIIRVYRRGN
ncbi:XdhC family protein [Moorella sp. Hama-1]|uniref:XdhC family protein n=1 Tax=Moorella sp. Hama-1 TaxID=2138101 RepID=UPI001379BAE2|nr:XdhC/CoxI family protein [Moorella sp. Hama-1]BCV22442.1 sulfurylase large subunit, molybdopterin cytosine dinucleotide biosynthesis [Moorella sp. Hama-1]